MAMQFMTNEEKERKLKEIREYKKKLVDEFVATQLKHYREANEKVLYFIADFYYHSLSFYDDIEQHCECLRKQFRAGYCYHFAMMLKDSFNRGEICWAAPFSHIVWVDEDDTAYDIEGVYESECEYLIPVSYLGSALGGFKHVRGLEYLVTEQLIKETIERYKKDLETKD